MKIKKNLDYQLYVQRENDFFHEPYKNELFIYEAIKQGDVDLIKRTQQKYGKNPNSGKGKLSSDPLRNQIYHLVVNAAMITRVCAAAGLPHETAYTLSDLYIRDADKCRTVNEVMELNDVMVLDFAMQMKQLKENDILSPAIRKTINYICDNLHKKITSENLAKNAGYNRSYLSVLFKKETKKSLSEYIEDKRIETAMNMLKATEFSCSDIALTLCFSSQSYFCKRFKQATGMTPNEFRKRNKEL